MYGHQITYCLVEVPSYVFTSLSGRGAKKSSSGILFSSCSDHPDGVGVLWFTPGTISHVISSVPTIMVAWGTIMTLMCLVNSYQGLIM
jgi:hypothetical protein